VLNSSHSVVVARVFWYPGVQYNSHSGPPYCICHIYDSSKVSIYVVIMVRQIVLWAKYTIEASECTFVADMYNVFTVHWCLGEQCNGGPVVHPFPGFLHTCTHIHL